MKDIKVINGITVSKEENGDVLIGDAYNITTFSNEESKELFSFLDRTIDWRTEEEIAEDKADIEQGSYLDYLDGLAEEKKLGHI